MKWLLSIFGLLIISTILSFNLKEEINTNTSKKNIILLVGDDIGFSDLELFGSEIPTPNINQLAKEGVAFTNFHANPACSVTRASLLSGADAHAVGLGGFDYMIYEGQENHPNYCGYMNDKALPITTLLKEKGYHTYMVGKWHLGHKEGYTPKDRDFDESYGIYEGGSSHFGSYGFLPTRPFIETYENGVEVERPEGIYSDDLYLMKLKEMISKNKDSKQPFFGYFAFQTAHLPIMAPDEFIEKFEGRYDEGWEVLRAQRRKALEEKGILTPDSDMLLTNVQQPDWDKLSEDEQRYMAKKMAVYAAMVNHQDYTIGLLIDYLKEIGEYDNTLIVYMSDNGPESGSQIGPRKVGQPILDWYDKDFDNSYENLGRDNSNLPMGSGWAFASSAPGNFFKFYVSEGGTRVPLVIRYPKGKRKGEMLNNFAHVTDVSSTILDFAGISNPKNTNYAEYIGKSMLPFMEKKTNEIHSNQEYYGNELFGNVSIFMGDYNLKRIRRGMKGSNEWELYHSTNDPGETTDLKDELPEVYQQLMEAKDDYIEKYDILPVDDDWDPYSVLK